MATDQLKPLLTEQPHASEGVPMFWPFTAAVQMEGLLSQTFQNNLDFLAEAERIDHPPQPKWATANTVRLDLDTMRLRDFTKAAASTQLPVVIDTPYAGHSSTIADYDKGQSLVETLLANGLERVYATDWKPATPDMRDFDIDKYLAELNAVIDDLGGQVHLIGLCQGGWLSAMLASRFPNKVRSLILAGSPIDTAAGNGPIKRMAHATPMATYEELVRMGDGRMPGRFMLAGWKNMHPDAQYVDKYLELYQHIEDRSYIRHTETFERWYENALDLPGRYYLQAISELFKANRFAKGEFTGLGRQLHLKDITCALYLLAGESDDITTREQVFAAEDLVGTPKDKIVKQLVPGGHIGLFMGSRTLADVWPGISRWLLNQQ